jgi:catechol 2,3-dioxygenase-like lactoylglutathione lyase family enzyme
MFRNPDHITIAVRDKDAAIELLGLFGFEVDHVARIDGGEPAAYMDIPDMHADHITLVLAGAEPRFEVQLLHFDDPRDDAGRRPSHLHELGMNHLAIRVDDIAAASEHLISHGVQPLNDEMDYISRKLRFFQGPEGVTLELVEYVGS